MAVNAKEAAKRSKTRRVSTSVNATVGSNGTVDDKNASKKILHKNYHTKDIVGKHVEKSVQKVMTGDDDDFFRSVSHSAGIFQRDEIDLFHKRYRFGILNPYSTLGNCREYLFFTKVDLNIFPRDNDTGIPSKTLHPYLLAQPFWRYELLEGYTDVLKLLQYSLDSSDPFNHLLENQVQTNLDVPSMTGETVDTPTNAFGVNYAYRGSSEASDDGYDFSLEFKDTKDTVVYHYFRAYEDYQTIRSHGKIRPWYPYIKNKVLYDQCGVFKFLVDMDDGESIIYYGGYIGVFPKTLPRDVFSNTNFDNGLSYSVDFHAAFYDDKPWVLHHFNNISRSYYNSQPYQIEVYNDVMGRIDNRPAKAAYVISKYDSRYKRDVYKLKWRGSDKY